MNLGSLVGYLGLDASDFDKGLDGALGKIEGFASRGVVKAAAAGAAIAGAVGGAVLAGMDIEKANDKLAAQLGAGSPLAEAAGQVAGHLYANAYGESLSEVNDAVRSVLQSGLLPEDATNAQIESITGRVLDLATTFDQDLGGTTNAVAQMIRTGMAGDATQALDILTRGFQQGNDKAGDLLDTTNEYSTQFRKLGLDGTASMGLISQAIQAGARDSDIAADALKEFSIRAVDGSKLTAEGFQMVGLNAGKMSAAIAAGGPAATDALGQVLDGLRGIEDPAMRSQAAVALFGTQAEDLGAALYAMDTSTAVQSMGNVEGAAAKMGAALNDNASTNLESFKRQATQAFVNVLGGQVLPVVSSVASTLGTQFGPSVSAVGGFLSGTLVPALQSTAQWVAANQTPIMIVAGLITAVFLPALIAMGIQSTIAAAKTVAAWLVTQASAIASLAAQSAAVVGVVAGWVLMGVQSMIQAARMAAAWLIAMGPVGWVIAAVVGVTALIVANWGTVVSWTRSAWSAVTGAIGAAWQWIKNVVSDGVRFLVGLFLNFTLVGLIIKHWDTIKSAFSNGVSAAVDFVRGLPGRAVSAIGNLGSLLYNAGRSLIEGFGRGIGDAFGAVKDRVSRLLGSVRNLFPFSPAKEGPFSGRGYTTFSGAALVSGFAQGIASQETSLQSAITSMLGNAQQTIASMRPAVAAEMLRMADTSALQSLPALGAGSMLPATTGTMATSGAGGQFPAAQAPEALLRVDRMTVIEGTPDDLARKLAVEMRVGGIGT